LAQGGGAVEMRGGASVIRAGEGTLLADVPM